MSIVTSIAAPAFADVYYIGNGSIDVTTVTKNDSQYVVVKQGDKIYTDTSDEIVIKDGIDEASATQQEKDRIEGKRAEAAVSDDKRPTTQELETAGPAAGEGQPDPDADFTLSEEEEQGKDTTANTTGNATDNTTANPTVNPTDNTATNPTDNTTDNTTENPKKDAVYQYAPADPEPKKQATKPTLSVSDAPTAETKEATQADTTTASPEGSAENPSKNVIRVVNDWVGKVLNIRLSNVNIKQDHNSTYADKKKDEYEHDVSGMTVKGKGDTKIELDGQNVLNSTDTSGSAGLYKDDGDGSLTITDETNDRGEKITSAKTETDGSGSLTAKTDGGNDGAAIGGACGKSTKNIIIEGYATVNALCSGNGGAGIGGGGPTSWGESGNAENIIIRGHSNVTAKSGNGAAIGGGSTFGEGSGTSCGSATGIKIYGHATVKASASGGKGAAIGAGGYTDSNTTAEVTIGTAGATADEEDVHVTAISDTGAAIGNGKVDTTVIIQGNTTIEKVYSDNSAAIGDIGYSSRLGTTSITIKDNTKINHAEAKNSGNGPAIGAAYANKLEVNIEGNTYLGTVKGVIGTTGSNVKEAVINIKDNAHIATITGGSNTIGGESGSGKNVTVNIDGGKNGNVRLDNVESGLDAAISGTSINIGDHVLIKLKQRRWTNSSGDQRYSKYLREKNDEKELTSVSGVSDNTALWYTDYNNKLQKIVHGKNFCKKNKIDHEDATCTKDGWVKYNCTFESESENNAANPDHNDPWVEPIPATGHQWMDNGSDSTHVCKKGDATQAHSYGEWTTVTPATCTTPGTEEHSCSECGHVETQEIPATGHHWVDNGDGTHTCTDCGATEALPSKVLPSNTNSALELRVVDAKGMDQPFTVSQNGTLRTYTGAYDIATLTGDLETLCYLQDHGAQTIQFVTNGQTSSFDIDDLLAQGSGSEVFYLTHRGAEEPTLLLVEADHSELVKD